MYAYTFKLSINLSVSSPYLLVFDNDRVIRYMGVDDVVVSPSEA